MNECIATLSKKNTLGTWCQTKVCTSKVSYIKKMNGNEDQG